MTVTEFSNEFDVLYNSVTSNQAPALDEYEKSVFLTKAQYEIQYAYLTPKGNKSMEGIEASSKRHIDFSNLLVTEELDKIDDDKIGDKFDDRSICFSAPAEMFIPINEKVTDSKGRYVVLPLNFALYDIYMSKPYQYPPKRHVWRLFTQTADSKSIVMDPLEPIAVVPGGGGTPEAGEVLTSTERRVIIELIGRSADGSKLGADNKFKYVIRYIKRARPIILTSLAGTGLTIDGRYEVSECELDKELHMEILTRAVELAKAAMMGDLNSQISLGNSSATDLGSAQQSKERDRE